MPTDENLRSVWSCSSILFVLVSNQWRKDSFLQKLQVPELLQEIWTFSQQTPTCSPQDSGGRAPALYSYLVTVSIEAKPL